MEQLTVQITSSAEADLAEIQFYLEVHAGLEIAERIVQGILDQIDSLGRTPKVGRKRDDVVAGVRSITEGNYVIYYEIVGVNLVVTRVLHAAMDIGAYFSRP